jgi:hypothetical protein
MEVVKMTNIELCKVISKYRIENCTIKHVIRCEPINISFSDNLWNWVCYHESHNLWREWKIDHNSLKNYMERYYDKYTDL